MHNKEFLKMKRILIFASVTFLFISCGPSEKEIKERKAFVTDSLRQVAIEDSIALVRAEVVRIHKENLL